MEQKVTCTICNGSGEVKYYFFDGNNDYNLGPCTSCEGKGYVMIKPTGNSNGGKHVICTSCGKYSDELITKKMPLERAEHGVMTAGRNTRN